MKVLVVGTDTTVFDKGSASRGRVEEYARLFDAYHIIVYTRRGFKKETLGTGSIIYPTNSWSIFSRPFDAVKIGSEIIREKGIDVVSVQDPAESGLAGWLLKKKFGIKLQIQVHSDFLNPFFSKNSLKEYVRYLLAIFILPRGDSFRVVSQRIKNSLETFLGISSSNITVLPIFVHSRETADATAKLDLKNKYPEFDFIILMVSRLVREKNIFLALEAFSDFKKEFSKSGLVIVGDGPELGNIKVKAYELGINDSVRFEGWRDDLAPYYKTASLYLLTSNFEGYGRSVVEAITAGLPVVMTDVGVAGEIVVDRDTGRVVQPCSREAIASALSDSRRNFADSRNMAQKAQRLFLKTSTKTWDDYLKMYKDSMVLGPRRLKIFYVTNARIPTEKAHGLATVKLCEAFADLGAEVTLFIPWRANPLAGDIYGYYSVKKNFSVKILPTIDLLWLGKGKRFLFLIQLLSFSVISALWLWLRYGVRGELKDAVIFSHDHIPLYFASFFAPNIFYDIHHFPERTQFYMRVLHNAYGISVQTQWKAAKMETDFGILGTKIVYWPNGTDVKRFDMALSKLAAREKLNLPQDKKIVLYAGQLFRWKGVETLIDAGRMFSGSEVFYIVGGAKEDIDRVKRESGWNIIFAGQRPWQEVPLWLKAADILVLPNTGKEKVSLYYTSPMKLFEYMASNRPIVASDIPSVREIADETVLFFAKADDPRSFYEVIRQVLADPGEAEKRAGRALERVRKYTWEERAKRILRLMRP